MFKKALLAAFIGVLTMEGMAQESSYYSTSGGVRLGFVNAVSLKHFIKHDFAIELIAGARYFQGPHAGILLEYHKENIFSIPDLHLFYGGGINVGA